jgi:hypothetical protein
MAEGTNGQVTLPPSNQRPVFIITEKERLNFTVGDTTFHYRRITPSKHSELRAAHTERGLFDEQARRNFLVDIATYCLCGWENLRDMQMQPVPFLPEVIPHLPFAVLEQLDQLCLEPSPDELMARYLRFLTDNSPSSLPGQDSPSPVGPVGSN